MKNVNIKEVNGLRGVLSLFIAFGAHVYAYWEKIGLWQVGFTNLVVEIFIMLSGFLVAFNYNKKDIGFKSFLLKRYLKLMPIYWLTTIVAYILLFVVYITKNIVIFNKNYSLVQVILEFTGLYTCWFTHYDPVNAPLWTINALILCYSVYFVIRKFTKDNKCFYIISLFCIYSLSLLGLENGWNSFFFCFQFSFRAYGSFIMGLFLYELKLTIDSNGKEKIFSVVANIVVLLIIIVAFILRAKGVKAGIGNQWVFGISVLPVFVFVFVFYNAAIRNLLRLRFFQILGRYSLSLYVWHYLVKYISDIYIPSNQQLRLYIYILCCIVCAIISNHCIEPVFRRSLKIND